MGGDQAPREIVEGALQAAPLIHSTIFLVGQPDAIKPYLSSSVPSNVEIVEAKECVEMDEKDGRAKAMVSAGNTGAASAFALLTWRQIPGFHRPAIATRLPNRHDGFVLLDSGASPDVDPEHLLEFALMGRAYAKTVMGRAHPKVHLLNIGEEEGKGNAFSKAVYQLMKGHHWFAGNIEPNHLFKEPCDVVVCDAFVGNTVLKTGEGVAEMITELIRNEVPKSPLVRPLFWPVKYVGSRLRKHMDYAEAGGAPLLGLNGLCVICHGRSNAKAIKNALLMTQTAIDNQLVESIRATINSA
jgi:glycerol-3-phosphate acyltransferase PlsX